MGKYWGKYVEIELSDNNIIKGFVMVFDSKEITKNNEDTLYLENREFEELIKIVYGSKILSLKEIEQDVFYNEIEANSGLKNLNLDRDELEWDLIVGMSAKKLVIKDYVGKYARMHCSNYGVVSGFIEKYDENYIDFAQDFEDQIVESALIMRFLNGDKMVLEESCIDAVVIIEREQVDDEREKYLRNMV